MKPLQKYLSIALLLPYLILTFISKVVLYLYSYYRNEIKLNFYEILEIFFKGLVIDFVTYIYIMLPILFINLFLPIKWKFNKSYQYLSLAIFYIFIASIVFVAFAEVLFWDEFSTRFNFIAVDYLVYTKEVVGNIFESYPIVTISIALIFSAFIPFFIFNKNFILGVKNYLSLQDKIYQFFIVTIISVLFFFFFSHEKIVNNNNTYIKELSSNGVYDLFKAFRNNSLDYASFYKSINMDDAFVAVKKQLLQNNQQYVEPDTNSITRNVKYKGNSKKLNVVLITVESLSNEFIGQESDGKNITPNISKLIKESVIFDNFYATGTRTIRGLEAVTLGIPPTPGSSIVRRQNNENLFSIASVLKENDYSLKFIYGGFGYFDNMNYFFANNHFKIIDRHDFKKNEISFANIWGVSDEDLLEKALLEADKSNKVGELFYQHIMTTSNHRPFTYPDNRIDIPSGTGRLGAVKYTDYAIGRFIEKAKNKKWFKDTIFIITADHCASSAGKTNIPMEKYHIPLLIYAPEHFKAKEIKTLASQIDLPPTILGLLNISFKSKFFGNDIFLKENDLLFMGTYQLLGYHQNNNFIILAPQRKIEAYKRINGENIQQEQHDIQIENNAISFYQVASEMFLKGLLKE